MAISNPDEWRLDGFRKSVVPGFKYEAVLHRIFKRHAAKLTENKAPLYQDSESKHTSRRDVIYVPFGKIKKKHYKDQTGVGLYSNLDDHNAKRRAKWKREHLIEAQRPYTPTYFEYKYLM